MDEAQSEATRASIDRLLAAAPAALSTKVDMLVATVDAAISKGITEQKLIGMEKQLHSSSWEKSRCSPIWMFASRRNQVQILPPKKIGPKNSPVSKR